MKASRPEGPNEHSARSRDPDDIERDIENTRRELDRTLEALQERLSPRRRFREAVSNAKESGTRLAGQVEDAARRYPVPIILAGATLAVALAARFMNHRRGGGHHTSNRGSFTDS